MTKSRKIRQPKDHRRTLVSVAAAALLVGYAYGLTLDESGGFKLVSEMMGRIGLVLGALGLAWDSLRRPAQWLPPGMALVCVLGLCVLAARRELIVFVIPAVVTLIAISGLVRAFRSPK